MRESHCAVMTTTDSAEGAEVLARVIVLGRQYRLPVVGDSRELAGLSSGTVSKVTLR
jgi:hypothetical protein